MARLPDFRDDGFPRGGALLVVIGGLMLICLGALLQQKCTPAPRPCPSPTPCACEQPWVAPPKMPTYSPEPGVETWRSLNREHPASEPLR